MTATIIDGTAVAARVRASLATDVARFRERAGRAPGLATIWVGDNPASGAYIRGKLAACEQTGIASFHHHIDASITQDALLQLIAETCADRRVDGVLVQLPLPAHIDQQLVLEAVVPAKDVDGFHPYNAGLIAAGIDGALPQCTPAGIITLLDEYDIPIAGADVTIVGRSAIVGRPLALMMLARDATVTMCHSRTRDLADHTRRADIVVMAVGRPGMLTADMVKPGAAVIDVGITRTDEGLRGDVEFASVQPVAGWITPVPGGVGPMTIATLLVNTLAAAVQLEALASA